MRASWEIPLPLALQGPSPRRVPRQRRRTRRKTSSTLKRRPKVKRPHPTKIRRSRPRARSRPRPRPSALLVAVDDPAAVEVVRRELDLDAVAREDANAVAPHLPGRVTERLVTAVES